MTEEQLQKADWLNGAFHAYQKVNALIAVQEQNKSLACKCTATYGGDGSTSGSHSNSQEAILQKICDDSMEIGYLISALSDKRKQIAQTIASIKDDELEAILYQRYLAYKSMQEIAEDMHYDRKTIQRKHIKALDKISNIVDISVNK